MELDNEKWKIEDGKLDVEKYNPLLPPLAEDVKRAKATL